MQELSMQQVDEVSGGRQMLSWDEGATLILALGAMGGPATFAFAFPIALGMYMIN